jgi:hypothetical protein
MATIASAPPSPSAVQKGMGLIMLILIGTVPTTYALNHALTPTQTQDFIRRFAASRQCARQVCLARCSHRRCHRR